MGRNDDGTDDPSWWFMANQCAMLGMLVKGDTEGLKEASDSDQAFARRVVIFRTTADDIGINLDKVSEDIYRVVEEEMAEEARYYSDLYGG